MPKKKIVRIKPKETSTPYPIYVLPSEMRAFEKAAREQKIVRSRSGLIKLVMRRFVNGWNKKKSRAKIAERAKFDKLARDGATGLLD